MTTDNRQPIPNISIEIGELVLHGFEPGQRHAIGAAVEQELARLIGERGWASQAGGRRVDGGSIEVAQGARPEHIGAQIAAAIYGASAGQNE